MKIFNTIVLILCALIYDRAEPGDYFYQVYFGDRHVNTYVGSLYSLPQ